MILKAQIAKQFKDFYFGGNWTDVNLKDTLAGVNWEMATGKVDDHNSIAALVFHMNYYVDVLIKVLKGQPLEGSDKLSFNHPPIESEEDWQKLQNKSFADAEEFTSLIEQLAEDKLWEQLGKYGNIYRNIHGTIEHNHYHLGQIVLIKKMLERRG